MGGAVSRRRALVLLCLLVGVLFSLASTTPDRADAQAAAPAAPLASGIVDVTGATGPVWKGVKWTAPATTQVGFTLQWTGAGDLRIDLRRLPDLAFVATTSAVTNPKTVVANVQAGVTYQIGVWAVAGAGTFTVVPATLAPRPNILIILSDDQRPDALRGMPQVKKWFGAQGATYTQGYVTTPSCCPSRAALLTGRYDHNNGVITQLGPPFDESTSIARYLHDAGYATGHIGKYVHYYHLPERAPYWDRWTYWQGGYENLPMNFDGVVRTGTGYSTRIAFDTALSYVNSWEVNDAQPWLMLVAPTAPHLVDRQPPPAEPRYAASPIPAFKRSPWTFEADISDKPPFIYCCKVTEANVAANYAGMTRAAYTIDDGVDKLFQRLAATGELDNTLAFYLSDNGILFGDHQLDRKFLPYLNSVGVPFLARWTGKIAPGTVDNRMVSNIDIAPTILAAAGVKPLTPMDGRDLLASPGRTRRLTEYWHDDGNIPGIPDWASLTTAKYEYTEYYEADSKTVKFREYYDLVKDPFELVNLFADGNPANNPNVTAISAQLRTDRTCRGSTCP